ncbi:hypothetical protein HN937_00235, partial [Candidatus Poribacteria bacterium]|nr:hypothetical protein [Candidatus Poribacteria bacterium]
MFRQLIAPMVGALTLTLFVAPAADARPGRFGGRSRDAVARLDLSDEQRDGIRAAVEELREADASRADIRDAIRAELAALGHDVPDGMRLGHRHGR